MKSCDRPSLQIAVDASSTVGPRTGVGNATAALLNALPDVLPEKWGITAWVNSPRHPLPADPWVRNPRITVASTRWPGKVLLTSWQHLRKPSIQSLAGSAKMLHSAAGYPIPAPRIKRLLSVHDLYFLQRPATEDPWGGGYFHTNYPKRLPEQDHLICFSTETAQDVQTVYRIPGERITVIPHGVDHARFRPEERPGERVRVAEWTKGEPYLLTVGTIGKRKNIEALIDAWVDLTHRVPEPPRLVIVGHRTGGVNLDAIEAQISRCPHPERVAWTGYVSDEDVAALYRHALAFVFPSIKEGFGLPVLEAMACGCPVACSGSGAIGEVAGEAALTVEVTSQEALRVALVRIVGGESLRQKLRGLGITRAAEFTWDRSARSTVEVYRRLLE